MLDGERSVDGRLRKSELRFGHVDDRNAHPQLRQGRQVLLLRRPALGLSRKPRCFMSDPMAGVKVPVEAETMRSLLRAEREEHKGRGACVPAGYVEVRQ